MDMESCVDDDGGDFVFSHGLPPVYLVTQDLNLYGFDNRLAKTAGSRKDAKVRKDRK
jgi:hypothetical protein